jgi:hypothetical protein
MNRFSDGSHRPAGPRKSAVHRAQVRGPIQAFALCAVVITAAAMCLRVEGGLLVAETQVTRWFARSRRASPPTGVDPTRGWRRWSVAARRPACAPVPSLQGARTSPDRGINWSIVPNGRLPAPRCAGTIRGLPLPFRSLQSQARRIRIWSQPQEIFNMGAAPQRPEHGRQTLPCLQVMRSARRQASPRASSPPRSDSQSNTVPSTLLCRVSLRLPLSNGAARGSRLPDEPCPRSFTA